MIQYVFHRRKHTYIDFGLSESRTIRGNCEITRHYQLAAATEGRTVYDRDRRPGHLFQSPKDCVERIEHLKNCILSVLLNSYAGAKGTTVRSRIENDSNQGTIW